MGLLDDTYAKAKALAGLLADAYQTGAQAYFPNEEDVKARPELAKGLLQFVPGPGDAISGYDALQSAKQGNYGEAALNGIGLLPFVPAMGGMTKNIINRTLTKADLTGLSPELVNRLRGVDESYRLPNLAQAVPAEYLPQATKTQAKTVKVYRGVPSNVDGEIRPGDWVALDRSYAKQHGGSGNKVITMEVPADHVGWAGTDMNEFFYLPRISE